MLAIEKNYRVDRIGLSLGKFKNFSAIAEKFCARFARQSDRGKRTGRELVKELVMELVENW